MWKPERKAVFGVQYNDHGRNHQKEKGERMRTKTIAKSVTVICGTLALTAAALGVHHVDSFAAYHYEDADKYTAGDAVIEGTVKNLDIDWTGGSISFEYHEGDKVEISEKTSKSLSEDKKMRWWLDGDTLRIQFAKDGSTFSSFGFDEEKELTVKLPESISLSDVSIDTATGDVQIPSLQAQKVTLDVSTGDIMLGLSGAEELKVSSATGDVEATLNKVRSAEIENASGDVDLSAPGLEKLDIDVTTGDVTVALSEKPGFTVYVDTVTGSFDYDIPLVRDGENYVCGDGSGSVKIDTTTGDIMLTSVS